MQMQSNVLTIPLCKNFLMFVFDIEEINKHIEKTGRMRY